MPNWVGNQLHIKIPPEVPESQGLAEEHVHFDALREFLAGTLKDNVEWLREWEKDHRVGLFWGWEFSIIELGTNGVTLDFLSKWQPPIDWVRAIHDRYPEWLLDLRFHCDDYPFHGSYQWDGSQWIDKLFWPTDKTDENRNIVFRETTSLVEKKEEAE